MDHHLPRRVAALREEYTAITATVADLPEHAFALPTPCTEWNVRDLLFHLSRDARRACIALATPVQAQPDVDLVGYWRTLAHAAPASTPYASGAEVRAVWEALSEVALLAAAAARPQTRVARQGSVLAVPDFLATLVTEACVHGLDLASALGRDPWAGRDALAITRTTLVGLLGGEPPRWDDVTFVLKATGRLPLSAEERTAVGDRLPLLT